MNDKWTQFKYSQPEWNTEIFVRVMNDPQTEKKVFYGSEERLNLNKIPNLSGNGFIGNKLEWKQTLNGFPQI